VCALVGVNGSGKSTLFNTIMGIIRPQSGSVRVNGLPVAQAMRQNGIAYVPQSENIDWHFPILVKDVVMLGRYGHMGMLRRPRAADREAVAAALERLGIADLAERQIGALSGGQKKRVFLARALAQQSRIILLDEPFTGVDAKTEFAVMELLKTLRDEGYLMLVSTHNLGAVPQYCNEVVLINRELIAHGDINDIYTVDNLERAFGSVLKNIGLGEVAPQVRIVSDDEHPAVFVDDRSSCP
jgi:ABC superfamily ATP binding cassette transporter, ABC protein